MATTLLVHVKSQFVPKKMTHERLENVNRSLPLSPTRLAGEHKTCPSLSIARQIRVQFPIALSQRSADCHQGELSRNYLLRSSLQSEQTCKQVLRQGEVNSNPDFTNSVSSFCLDAVSASSGFWGLELHSVRRHRRLPIFIHQPCSKAEVGLNYKLRQLAFE